MIITCDQCGTRYNLDVSTISKPVFKVRCTSCDHRFEVHKKLDIDTGLLEKGDFRAVDDHKIVAISNQKGGVAKTTTCLNLGMSLALLGRKVLLVDFDVQANLTTALGYPANSLSFYDILQSEADNISAYIRETRYDDLHLLPSNSRMALLTKNYMYQPNFELLLKDRLHWIADRYDYVLIDTPPALGFSTLNALMASNCVIIPTPCEYLSMHGIHKIEDIIRVVRKKAGHPLDYRILITMHDPHSTASKAIFRKIKEIFKERVLETVIELDEKMKESLIVKLPVARYDDKSKSARQYMALAREFEGLNS